jgi:hypothetical protein
MIGLRSRLDDPSFFRPFATISRATAATEPAIAATEPAIVGRDDVAAAVVTDAIGAVGVNRAT